MKNNKLIRIQFLVNCMIIIILAGGVLLSIKQYLAYREYNFYNNARLLATEQLKQIENALASDSGLQNVRTGEYPVVVVDLEGNILYSKKESYSVGDIVNLNEFMQIDKYLYATDKETVKAGFVLMKSGKAVGFAAFFLPREEAFGIGAGQILLTVYMPVFIAFLLIICLLLFNRFYSKRRIITPVQEMIASSKAIIDGNYSVAVVKTDSRHIMDNDVDKLSYNFEIMRDELREKRRREEELKRSQKELISCISHDLKTPISTIKAYSEGLRDGMAKDPEKIARYADIIVHKTQVLTKMISDLLEHTNSELNQLIITKREQYFNAYMDKLAGELKQVAEHNGINFFYDNKAANLLVTFDENRITQVITNLFDNSIKYGKKEEGSIGLRITFKQETNLLYITVWDDGNGIGEIDKPFVFDKFFRGEKSRSMSIPGSGLGLSICKYIVEQHDGTIECESSMKEGTAFTFTLPV